MACDDRRKFDWDPHPRYGPCDAFGGDGQWCSMCAEIIWSLFDDAVAERCRCRVRVVEWRAQ